MVGTLLTGPQHAQTRWVHSGLWSSGAPLCGDGERKCGFKRLAEVTSEEEVFKGSKIDL